MTAIFAFSHAGLGYVFSDGAEVGADGLATGLVQKVHAIVPIRAVVGMCGPSELGLQVLDQVERYPSFDASAQAFGAAVKAAWDYALPYIRGSAFAFDGLTAVLAGWSEARDRFEVYVAQGGGSAGTWNCEGPRPGFLSSFTDDQRAEAERRGLDLNAVLADPVKLAPDLMAAFRATPQVGPSGLRFPMVGGFCQESRISRDGLCARIVKRWPDRIGDRIAES